MKAKRLLKLANFLEQEVPKHKFDMAIFVSETDEGHWPKEAGHCGTTACAGGWATAVPAFRKRGLKLSGGTITYNNLSDYSALSEFFDLSHRQTEYLFGGDARSLKEEVRVLRLSAYGVDDIFNSRA